MILLYFKIYHLELKWSLLKDNFYGNRCYFWSSLIFKLSFSNLGTIVDKYIKIGNPDIAIIEVARKVL